MTEKQMHPDLDHLLDPMPRIRPFNGETDFKAHLRRNEDLARECFAKARETLGKIAGDIWQKPEAAMASFDRQTGTVLWPVPMVYLVLMKRPDSFGALVDETSAALAKTFVVECLMGDTLQLWSALYLNAGTLVGFWEDRDRQQMAESAAEAI